MQQQRATRKRKGRSPSPAPPILTAAAPASGPVLRPLARVAAGTFQGMAVAAGGRPQPFKDVIEHPPDHTRNLTPSAASAFGGYFRSKDLTAPDMTRQLGADLAARPTKTAHDLPILASIQASTAIDRTGTHVAHKLSDNVTAGITHQMGSQAGALTPAQHKALYGHAFAMTGSRAHAKQYAGSINKARTAFNHPNFATDRSLQNRHGQLLRNASAIASNGLRNLRHGSATLNMAASRAADWNRRRDGRLTPFSRAIHNSVHGLAAAGLITRQHAQDATTPAVRRATGQPISSSEVAHSGPSGTQRLIAGLAADQEAAKRPAKRRKAGTP